MRDVAERIGISHSAVSMALRNHPSIPLKRREEVKRLAEQMGYHPDPFLSALATYRRKLGTGRIRSAIAWINRWEPPASLRQFREFDSYWHGAAGAFKQFGFRLEEVVWEADCSPKRLESILLARGTQGILLPPHVGVLDWGDFNWARFSVVRFGTSMPVPDSNSVTSDRSGATVMALNRIINYGYKRIGFLVGKNLDLRTNGTYCGSYFWVQNSLKLRPALPPLLTDYAHHTPTDLAKQCALLKKWLIKNQPDAILTTDAEIPDLLKSLGYRIPQDVAVAGTSLSDIPLDSGIDQHSEEIGRIAAETLVKQITVGERGIPTFPTRILVESSWHDGKSLPPRKRA